MNIIQNFYLFLWVIIWLLFWYLIAKLYYRTKISKSRKNAVQQSKSVIYWQVNEKIAPLLPEFKYKISDLVFIWKWVDYIVFDGLSDWKLNQIVFMEIKTWQSSLNNNEKQIKIAIENWKIKYELLKL